MRTSSVFGTLLAFAAFPVFASGCGGGGGIEDLRFDFGVDLGDDVAHESVTLTGNFSGQAVPSEPATEHHVLGGPDHDVDLVLLGYGASESFGVGFKGDFRLASATRSFAEPVSISCNAPETGCAVELLIPSTASDGGTQITTDASLTSDPIADGKVRIHVTARTTNGGNIDLVIVAPVDASGKLVLE